VSGSTQRQKVALQWGEEEALCLWLHKARRYVGRGRYGQDSKIGPALELLRYFDIKPAQFLSLVVGTAGTPP